MKPTQLVHDDTVAPELRDALRAAREQPPVSYDDTAGLARFSALVAVGGGGAGGAGGAGATGTAGGSGGAVSGGMSVKAVAIVFAVLGAAAGGGWIVAGPSAEPPPVRHVDLAEPSTATPHERVEPTALPEVSAAPPPEAVEAEPVPVPSAAPKSAPFASSAAAKAESLNPEIKQYREVLTLSGSDPARALAMADAGHARFPGGHFWPEREAIAIGALARLGRAGEARARAQAFLARYPESPMAESLKSVAAAPSP